MAPPGAPRGVIRSPTRPLFLPSPVLESRGSGHAAMQHPAPGLLPRGALLGNAVPAPDRGSVAAPPTAPEKCRSARSGPSLSSGISRASTNEEGLSRNLFSQNCEAGGVSPRLRTVVIAGLDPAIHSVAAEPSCAGPEWMPW